MVNLKSNYFLLLVDVVQSTALPNGKINAKMHLLQQLIKTLNKKFDKESVIPLTVSYGDEIAGLFNSPEHFYTMVSLIRKHFYPLTTIRFVAVKGKIAVVSKDIREVGGTIFKIASHDMAGLKQREEFCSWQLGNPLHDECLKALCNVSNVLIEDMSHYQREVFELLLAGNSQKKIADQLGKYTQSVWDAVKRSKADYVLEAGNAINLILANAK